MREPLLHFSRKPLREVHSARQSISCEMKPNGLWVSVGIGEDSWPHWCRAEAFDLDRFEHASEVILRDDAKVLRLEGHDAIAEFDDEFCETPPYISGRSTFIAWHRVAARYQGIVIAPYVWSQRMGSCFWYCSWDCASGCIWDAAAIVETRPVHGLDLHMEECTDA